MNIWLLLDIFGFLVLVAGLKEAKPRIEKIFIRLSWAWVIVVAVFEVFLYDKIFGGNLVGAVVPEEYYVEGGVATVGFAPLALIGALYSAFRYFIKPR